MRRLESRNDEQFVQLEIPDNSAGDFYVPCVYRVKGAAISSYALPLQIRLTRTGYLLFVTGYWYQPNTPMTSNQ